jgi:hypothetical protein
MSTVVYYLSGFIIGVVLSTSGLSILTWQFWVIAVAMLGMLVTVGKV